MTHVQVPDQATEARDQRDFDEAVEKKGKVFLELLAGVGVLAAVVMSAIAMVQSGEKSSAVVAAPAVKQVTTASATVASTPAAKPIALKIIPSYKVGPDGKKHDAFTQTEFAVKVGQPVKLTIDNTDESAHSITAPVAGVNISIPPGIHTYTLVVKQAGKFKWYCMIPCDSDANGWAMQNPGYMSGYITAS